MAFTYTTLTNAINDYTQNSNWGSSNPDQLNVIIQQAEERINLAVNVANYNTKTYTDTHHSANIVAGSSSIVIASSGPGVSVDNVTSPTSPLYFKIRSGNGTDTNPWVYLLLKDYNFLQEYAPYDASANRDQPKFYSFYNDVRSDGKATFAFAPIADGTYDFEILYLFQPPSIVTDISGTWLSTHGSSALLYGCLVEAYTFMKGEPDLIQLYDAKFKEALQVLVASQGGSFRNATYRDQALRGAA
jgi:hypothetical protein